MSVIDKIKLDGTTYDVGKTPDTTLAVSGSPADAAKVGTELEKKVDKVTGKGLSTEDFTTAEKTKLAGIAEGATALTIDATLTQSGQPADAKVVGEKIADLKDDLSDYFGRKIDISMSTSAQFINLSGTTADINSPSSSGEGFHYGVYACEVGDVFEVNAVGGAGARAWGFISSDGTILTVADSLATVNTKVTAPTNSAYFIVNDKSGQTSYKLNGDTIPERVSALESDVVELQEEVDSFEGISEEVKEALLACFRHVAFVDNEEDYYGALEEALGGVIPEIKVFLGKGTSVTEIVDNSKRALSEPIPFTNEIPITMQWADNNGYVWQPKPLTSQHGITSGIVGVGANGVAYERCRMTVLGTGRDEFWTDRPGQLILADNDSTVPVTVQDTDGTFRILFANGADQTADLPSIPPSGFFFVGNKKYRLVVGNNEELI